jgi:hypothetical protein
VPTSANPAMDRNKDVSYFARTNYRRKNIPFGIKQADRLSHI